MQTASVTLQVPVSVSEADAELLLAAKLFETNKLSLGHAAELSGYSYRAFWEVLHQNKIPVVNYPPSKLEKNWEYGIHDCKRFLLLNWFKEH